MHLRIAVILGLTFKENCLDIRNSKVYDLIKRLNEYEIDPIVVCRSLSSEIDAMNEYGVRLNNVKNANCNIVAVAHDVFRNLKLADMKRYYNTKERGKVLIDVKGFFNIDELISSGLIWWRL